MESTVPKEFIEKCEEGYIPDSCIFMKEELIITDVNNQLDNDQVVTATSEHINSNDVKTKQEAEAITNLECNGIEPKEEEEDDIEIISEEVPTTSKKSSKPSVIIPEIVEQMMKIKSGMKEGQKVPHSIVFVKKCRLCQKVQSTSRSQTMIKCQECSSKCFLFQCLLCFKRYTTFVEVFNHIDKKHADKVFKENVRKRLEIQQQQQQPSKGIKVKSNKCLKTDERFQFNIHYTRAQKVNNDVALAPASTAGEIVKAVTMEETVEQEEDEDLQDNSNNLFEVVLKEDIPLKQTEMRNSVSRFSCDLCDYSSPFKRYVREHRHRHENVDPENYQSCSVCNKTFKNRSNLNSHLRHCGKEPDLKCKFCEYKTKHMGTLKVHMQIHVAQAKVGELEPLANAEVGSSSQSDAGTVIKREDDASKSHEQNVQSEFEIAENEIKNTLQAYCSKCNRRTKATPKRKQCIKCNKPLAIRCKTCNYKSTDYAELYRHVIRVHFAFRSKPCPNRCGKVVTCLRSHLRLCGVEPSYRCKYCPFRTKHEFSYVAHMRHKHQHDEKGFHECQKCGKKFAVARYLVRHQKTYCDTAPSYGCAHCSLKTRSKSNLVRHMQLLHVETMSDVRFNCKTCGQLYTNVYMYDKHVKHCSK